MNCDCSLTEKIIAILVIVFAWWNLAGYNSWILTILGLILLWHAFSCKNCTVPMIRSNVKVKKQMAKTAKKKKK